jgi:hypothetical protein
MQPSQATFSEHAPVPLPTLQAWDQLNEKIETLIVARSDAWARWK